MEYTKGEWKVIQGLIVPCQVGGSPPLADNEIPTEYRIAEMFEYPDVVYSKDEIRANAQLISAAPELYEALEQAQQDINWMLNNEKFLNPHVFDYLEKALAKAEGK